jgi:hypothetical protein
MSAFRSSRYDFGACEVDYVTETDFYSRVTMRFRQIDGDDEAQVTLDRIEAIDLLQRALDVLMSDPTGLITAQLSGQKMTTGR